MEMTAEDKIRELKLVLPPVPAPAGLYEPILVDGSLAYVSGHLPMLSDGTLLKGKIGTDLTLEDGISSARQAGLNILATLRHKLGNLDRISRIVKILGMVSADSGFAQHPQVINGCSELFKQIWGEQNGVGVRSAFGVSGLPGNACVEIEGIFKIKQ